MQMKNIFEMTLEDQDSWEYKFLEIKNNWPRQTMDLSLDRIKKYLELIHNPQEDLKVIHIGGTNGKGSTGTFIKSILEKANLKVGFFSSPAIISDNESIKVNNDFISYELFTRKLFEILKNWKNNFDVDNFISFFEATTIIATEFFKEEKVDIAIFEVGLGGRLDSTNVFSKKMLNIITHIGLDHLGILGNSIEEIALEKAGIIQEGDLVLAYPIPTEATRVIETKVKEKNGRIFKPDFNKIVNKNVHRKGSTFSYKEFEGIEINLTGENQIYNSIVAIESTNILRYEYEIKISEKNIRDGLREAFIPGRLEWIEYKGKEILLDGAHNQDGMDGFVEFVNGNIDEEFNLVVGILKDKEYKKMFYKLSKLNCTIYLTEVPVYERKLEVEEAFETMQAFNRQDVYAIEDPIEAVERAIEESGNSPILVTGSLYLISKIRSYLLS